MLSQTASNRELRTARDFLQKFKDDRADFQRHPQSTHHAIHVAMTGFHLHDWVWGELRRKRPNLVRDWGLEPNLAKAETFGSYLGSNHSIFCEAGAVASGAKNFELDSFKEARASDQGRSRGPLGAFQDSSTQSKTGLWIQREDNAKQSAEAFFDELISFWDDFFKNHMDVRSSGDERPPAAA